jgi:Transposase IS116/IS110/IS902 family
MPTRRWGSAQGVPDDAGVACPRFLLRVNDRYDDAVDAKLMAWHRADECSRRLAKIPGVGPIGEVQPTMKTPDPKLFKSGRQFAAWIGLTPKDHSTGDGICDETRCWQGRRNPFTPGIYASPRIEHRRAE